MTQGVQAMCKGVLFEYNFGFCKPQEFMKNALTLRSCGRDVGAFVRAHSGSPLIHSHVSALAPTSAPCGRDDSAQGVPRAITREVFRAGISALMLLAYSSMELLFGALQVFRHNYLNSTHLGFEMVGKVGAPAESMKGNSNAQKRGAFVYQLRRVLHDKPEKLRKIAEKLLEEAENGESWAIKEVIDRLDGKAIQATEISGPDGGEIQIQGDATQFARDLLSEVLAARQKEQ